MTNRITRRFALPLLAGTLALGLGACIEDETVVRPPLEADLIFFQRYVSLGNSLTAGWMSGGINDSTQRLAYPVLLAEMAGARFEIPSLVMPGCPPPLTRVIENDTAGVPVLSDDRVLGGTEASCSLRSFPAPDFVQNLAVPGSKIADAWDLDRPGNSSNPLTTLINGGMTQVGAMRQVQPTLVTMWLGNNDVLEGALQGDTTLLTPADTFETYAQRIIQAIAQQSPLGVALIGVLDVTLAPRLQPGLYYWVADSLGFLPRPARNDSTRLTVSDDCAPTDSTGALNPLSMNEVSWNVIADSSVLVISCDPAAPYVLTTAERQAIDQRVDAFNDVFAAEAQSRGWVFLSSTAELNSQLSGTAGHNRLRRCVNLNNTLEPDLMVQVVETQCPHPDAPNFFGSLVTYDGIHMSAAAHEIMAEALADALNSKYDLDL